MTSTQTIEVLTTQTTQPIVVGVDGSHSSIAALKWALHQAELTGAAVIAISTWEWPVAYGEAIAWPEDVNFETDAAKVLRSAVDEARGTDHHMAVTEVVIHGQAADELDKRSRDASLIVVGSRGHGEFTGMLLGSVGEHLVTHAHCPVVVVRSDGADH